MIVFHSYVDFQDPAEAGTWGWFRKHETDFRQFYGWDFRHSMVVKGNDYSYSEFAAKEWGESDLLFWERDNLPASIGQILELETCPEPVCSIDYEMVRCLMVDAKSVRTRAKIYPEAFVCVRHQRGVSMMRDFEGRTDPGDWTHAPNPPLGLTRFRLAAQAKMGDFPRERWQVLDVAVARLMEKSGFSAHIHRPRAPHYHRFLPDQHVHPAFAERSEPILRLGQIEPSQRRTIAAVAGVVL